jgi:hypothetical protein
MQSKKELKILKFNLPIQYYNLPFLSTGNHTTAILLLDVMICQSAFLKILCVQTTAWRMCATNLKNGTVPAYGLLGLPTARAKIFEEKVGPKLKEFLENDVKKWAGR